MKRLLIILLILSFSVLILINIPNAADTIITLEEFNNIWQRAKDNLETNNPGGHSHIYTDTELVSEDVGLNSGWIEGIGVWGIGFNWFESGVIPVIQIGYYDNDGIYHPTGLHEETPRVEDGNYTYYTLIAPPDFANFSPGTNFPSIGFYVPDDDL